MKTLDDATQSIYDTTAIPPASSNLYALHTSEYDNILNPEQRQASYLIPAIPASGLMTSKFTSGCTVCVPFARVGYSSMRSWRAGAVLDEPSLLLGSDASLLQVSIFGQVRRASYVVGVIGEAPNRNDGHGRRAQTTIAVIRALATSMATSLEAH